MSQHDYVIANGTGAAVRSDLNNALAAIVTQNSGATAPATTYAYQWWADTTTGLLKIRNAANNAWVTIGSLSTAGFGLLAAGDTLTAALGSASTPGITFTGDLNTGIYSPGADQVAISTNGSGRLFVDASGRVLVGTSTSRNVASGGPSIVQIEDSSFRHLSMVQNSNDDNGVTLAFGKSRGTSAGGTTIVQNNDDIANIRFAGANGSDVATVAAQIRVQVDGTPGTTNDMPGRITFWTTADASGSPTERMRITSAGNVGIGTTSPLQRLHVCDATATDGTIRLGSEANYYGQVSYDYSSTYYTTYSNYHLGGGAGGHRFLVRQNNEAVRIDTSGRLLVGTSSNTRNTTIVAQGHSGTSTGPAHVRLNRGDDSPTTGSPDLGYLFFGTSDNGSDGGAWILGQRDGGTWSSTSKPGRLVFSTTADGASTPTERMRISQNGDVAISATGTSDPIAAQINGTCIGATVTTRISRLATTVLALNRSTNDGNLVEFYQDANLEGTISVSGTTVSYNGAHLSRWSQLPSGVERTEILRGTVLSNLDEMCEWGEEDNEQLNRMKVSDVEGDKNVSGVFQAWDDDDDTYTNDFYCAMTGDFIIRIAAGVTVERGDLLMSAGDGTAKPQGDGYVQDKTIAKVTSTNVSCTYEDGSYCVPCVLMAC